MLRISCIKEKIIFFSVYICGVLLMHFLDIGCIILRLTGVRCPGCGMTRACLAALRFDFAAAFRYHPMFWSVPLLFMYIIFDDACIKSRLLKYIFPSFIGLGFLVTWILRLM